MNKVVIGLGVVLILMAIFAVDDGDRVERYAYCDNATEQFGSTHPDYSDAVCRGEELAEDGDLRPAIRAYEVAAQVRFPEEPNYQAYLRIAELRCELGEQSIGMTMLSDYECALDVQMGQRPCFETDLNGNPQVNRELPRGCAIWMCSEIYLPGYVSPSEATAAKVASMRTELGHVRQYCANGP